MMAKNQNHFATSEKIIPDGAYVGEWHKKTIQVEFNGWPRFYELKTTKSILADVQARDDNVIAVVQSIEKPVEKPVVKEIIKEKIPAWIVWVLAIIILVIIGFIVWKRYGD